jgi:hypothetical protein
MSLPAGDAIGAATPRRRAALESFGPDLDTLIIRQPDSDRDLEVTVKTQPRRVRVPNAPKTRVLELMPQAVQVGVDGSSTLMVIESVIVDE